MDTLSSTSHAEGCYVFPIVYVYFRHERSCERQYLGFVYAFVLCEKHYYYYLVLFLFLCNQPTEYCTLEGWTPQKTAQKQPAEVQTHAQPQHLPPLVYSITFLKLLLCRDSCNRMMEVHFTLTESSYSHRALHGDIQRLL